MMKRKIIISFSIVFVIVLLIAVYTQIWKPLIIVPKEVVGITLEEDIAYIERQAEEFIAGEYDKVDFFNHSFHGTLPSQNPEDYVILYCTLDVKNRSIFHMNTVTAFVSELKNHEENVLFSDSSDSAVERATWRFSSQDETFRINIYIADMDENAIKDLIKGLKVKVIYKGEFIGDREEIIDFKDCENISLEL